MTIWAMSDLHLAISTPSKTMEEFGNSWSGYIERIREGFINKVGPDDTVLIPGDLSWVMYMKDGYEDFKFIDSPDISESANKLVELYLQETEKYGVDNVALLSPYRQKTEKRTYEKKI